MRGERQRRKQKERKSPKTARHRYREGEGETMCRCEKVIIRYGHFTTFEDLLIRSDGLFFFFFAFKKRRSKPWIVSPDQTVLVGITDLLVLLAIGRGAERDHVT